MSSFGSLLSIARTAVVAHQHAITVASQNVTNAATEGYSRQRAELVAGDPVTTPQGVFGTGVFVDSVRRARDELLDATYRRDTASAAGSAMSRDLLGSVEGVFNEPSESGLGATLDAFWDSWGDLANSPNSSAAKTVVRQRAEQLGDRLRSMSGQLDDAEGDARARLAQTVGDINGYGEQIAALNERIIATEVTGQTANDLRDSRDRLVDKLATLGPVRVIEAKDGSAAVLLGSTTIVDANNPRRLELQELGGATTLALSGTDRGLPDLGGAVGALVRAVNVDIPGTRSRLDAIAGALVDTVNGAHQRGYSRAGELAAPARADWTNADPALRGSRVEFFDSTAVGARTARGLSLSAAVAADAGAIATGYAQNGDGDNSLALAIGALRDKSGVVGSQSINAYYRDTVAGVAARVNAADRDATAGEALARQADTRRQSVSGVSTDEELISIMRFQQAYTAATRLIRVADEMTQELLSLVN